VAIDIAPDAISQRDSTISFSQLHTDIDTQADLAEAIESIRELRAIQKATEDSRTSVKKPVLELGKAIDAKAKEFIGPVEAEMARVNGLVTAYQYEQERLRQEAERQRMEAIKKAQEAEARARAEAEAQRRKIEEEARAAAAAAKAADDVFAEAEATAKAQAAAAEEALRIAAAQAASKAATTAAVVSTAAAIAPVKPEGVQVRREVKFRVTNALALANARLDLVMIEPVRGAIMLELKRVPEWEGEKEVAPGLVAWWEGKVVVR
jgi:hypothetical protein